MTAIPSEVQGQLKVASQVKVASLPTFSTDVCGNEWDRFIEEWASVCYGFVANALGPYATEPRKVILGIHDGAHSGGANASFQLDNGQIRLSPSVVQDKPGITLEKLTHELTHAALADFPDDEGFYTEGFVDYSVWVMSHAPIWGEHRDDMIEAASFNIACRRDRAMRDTSDYDRKRWAGGLFCSLAHGPWIVARLKLRKAEGNYSW